MGYPSHRHSVLAIKRLRMSVVVVFAVCFLLFLLLLARLVSHLPLWSRNCATDQQGKKHDAHQQSNYVSHHQLFTFDRPDESILRFIICQKRRTNNNIFSELKTGKKIQQKPQPSINVTCQEHQMYEINYGQSMCCCRHSFVVQCRCHCLVQSS